MIQNARITLYNVERCGYYQWGGKDIPEFGDLATILAELEAWSRGKPLGNTRTFDPTEGNLEPTYCFDLRKSPATGDYLLTTWNEVPSDKGGVAVVDPRSAVGQASVSIAPVPGNSIPGYATYFWIVPTKKTLATVTFRNQRNGQQNLIKYMHEFIAKFARFAVPVEDEDSDLEIAGYRRNVSEAPRHLIPSFRTAMVRRKAEIEWVRDNRENITQIVRKNLLTPAKTRDRTFFRRLMTGIGIYGEPEELEHVKIKYEVAYTPTEDELDTIISEWEGRTGTEWENVGFRVRGVPAIFWLNGAIVRETFSLNVEIEHGVIEPRSLIRALEAGRSEILALL